MLKPPLPLNTPNDCPHRATHLVFCFFLFHFCSLFSFFVCFKIFLLIYSVFNLALFSATLRPLFAKVFFTVKLRRKFCINRKRAMWHSCKQKKFSQKCKKGFCGGSKRRIEFRHTVRQRIIEAHINPRCLVVAINLLSYANTQIPFDYYVIAPFPLMT